MLANVGSDLGLNLPDLTLRLTSSTHMGQAHLKPPSTHSVFLGLRGYPRLDLQSMTQPITVVSGTCPPFVEINMDVALTTNFSSAYFLDASSLPHLDLIPIWMCAMLGAQNARSELGSHRLRLGYSTLSLCFGTDSRNGYLQEWPCYSLAHYPDQTFLVPFALCWL